MSVMNKLVLIITLNDRLLTRTLCVTRFTSDKTSHPRQQKIRTMNGAHLASPIRGELGYAHRPQLGSQIHCPIGNQIWGPLGKDNVCPNFSLTVGKFVFSNSGNFRANANPPKPRFCPKRSFGQRLWPHSSADWVNTAVPQIKTLGGQFLPAWPT